MNEKTIQSSQTDANKQEVIDDILQNLPVDTEIELTLPSKCKFYNLPDPHSPVSVKPLTFEDEKAIANIKASEKIDPISFLLSKSVSNLNLSELLPMDKLYILYKIREISYGPMYPVLITCPKCREDSEVNIDLSNLLVNEVPDDLEDPRTIMLPTLKKEAVVKFPRLKDEKYLNLLNSKNAQLWRFIESIDGHSDKQIISKVLEKMPLVDMHLILKELGRPEYGIDSKINFICGACEGESVVDIPIGENFFS